MSKNTIHPSGLVPSRFDARDFRLRHDAVFANDFPDDFALLTPTVKNQGSKPTCAAHAGSTIIEGFYEQEHGKHRVFSTMWIYGIRETGYYLGDGMSLRDVCNTLHKYGDCYNADLPGNENVDESVAAVNAKRDELAAAAYPHRITKYFKVDPSSRADMRRALMNHGYLLVSMTCREGDYLAHSRIWTTDTARATTGRHAVVIYGWCPEGWLVQNSWGAMWGDRGRFVLPYDFKLNEVWGTQDNNPEGEDDLEEPYDSKFGKFIAKCINAIASAFYAIKRLFKKTSF